MADQLRWDAVGAYGNPHVRTPHLDRIAREGARFERCYTASPICMPARASMLTGRWPHAHGLWDNGVRLPPETATLGTTLAAYGYRTAIVGKGHLDLHQLPDSHDSFEGWNTQQAIALGGKDGWHGPYYGFQEAHLTCGHNRACGHYGTWLHTAHPEAVPLLERDRALEAPVPGAWQSALPVELHASTWIGNQAVDFIRRQGSGRAEQPFFLWASFPDPHPPLCPPRAYADRYDPANMPPPVRREGRRARRPPGAALGRRRRVEGVLLRHDRAARRQRGPHAGGAGADGTAR
jgi:arylsulfatase A-like enzyme